MFVNQQIKIARLGAMRVGDLVLEDSRHLKTKELTEGELAPIRKAWTRLQSYVTTQRPETKVCANDPSVRDQYNQAFDAYRAEDPRRTTDDFDEIYEPDYDDTDLDPRLGAVTFVVSQDEQGIVGLFHLYNIRISSDTPEKLVVSAYASPSFDTTRGYLDPDDVGTLMRDLLEKDIKFDKGERVFDVDEWRFPTRKSHAWKERKGGDLTHRALAHLNGHNRTDKAGNGDVVPEKIRRAPPALNP